MGKEIAKSRFGEGKSPLSPISKGGVLRLRALTIKSLGLLSHPTRQHDTLARGSWAESLGSLVFLAGGSKPRATAVRERKSCRRLRAVSWLWANRSAESNLLGWAPGSPSTLAGIRQPPAPPHTGVAHLPCEGVTGIREAAPTQALPGRTSLHFPSFLLPLLLWRSEAQALMTVNPTDKALPRVTTHPQMWAALQFQDSPCFFPAPTWSHLPLSILF